MNNLTTIKRYLYLPPLFVLITLMGFTCENDPPEPEYDLEVGIKISPDQATHYVGDTIILKYKITDNSIYDTRSGTNILLGKTSIPFKINFGKRDVDGQLKPLANAFSIAVNNVPDSLIFLEENGEFSELSYELTCEIVQGNYEVEIVCALLKKGIYRFEIWGNKSIYFSGNEDCSVAPINPYDDYYANMSYTFDVYSTNSELIEESPTPPNVFNVGDPTIRKTNNREMYWIKVVD